MTTLARAARRRLARGDTPTERITLADGRWIEVFVRQADRGHLDNAQRARELLAAFVARTNVVDAAGEPIDPSSADAWQAIRDEDYPVLVALLAGMTDLVGAKRIDPL